jgi:branched-chain amino acid transport system ATP-binding protein
VPLLELEGVHAAYGPSRVLHGVSLEAAAGEVVSLLGRNGAGKSSTLKAIVGLVEITGGAVRFDGREITRLPTYEIGRLGIGYVPEDRRISWSKRISASASLSGGEQQMLTVARTLMGNPRLLLLDEPSEGLAPVIVKALGEQVAALKRRGLTILLSERDLKFAARLADRAYIIERGEIRFAGPMSTLLVDPALRRAHLSV